MLLQCQPDRSPRSVRVASDELRSLQQSTRAYIVLGWLRLPNAHPVDTTRVPILLILSLSLFLSRSFGLCKPTFREFFRSNYAELKTLNPSFPILLREGTGADPYLLATYGESPLPLGLLWEPCPTPEVVTPRLGERDIREILQKCRVIARVYSSLCTCTSK